MRIRIAIILLLMCLYAGLSAQTNRADYNIYAKLDTIAGIIEGTADIVYINNSPDIISQINFHLYANYFSENGEYYTDRKKPYIEEKSGYTVIDSIVNENGIKGNYRQNNTMGYYYLNYESMPEDTVRLKVFFRNKVPYPYLREGRKNGQYDLTQWYPKVAVFSKGKWSDFQAGLYAEFYNEYGNYEVTLELPGNYFVFGTGTQVEPLSDLELIDSIASSGGYYSERNNSELKTVKFIAYNVHDCALSLRKEFSIIREVRDSLTVLISCSKQMRPLFAENIDCIFGCIDYYSGLYGAYAQNQLTIASGVLTAGSGMEYPGFIIVGDMPSTDNTLVKTRVLEEILVHEIAHQWFYYKLAVNEAMEPFMDESFANFATMEYMNYAHGNDNYYLKLPLIGNIMQNDIYYTAYLFMQKQNELKPMNFSSYEFKNMDSYAVNYYMKGVFVLRTMRDMIGKSRYDSIIAIYCDKYAFSHPQISDFEALVNAETDYMYSYELKNLLYENVHTDYYIKRTEASGTDIKAYFGSDSPFSFPVTVHADYADGRSVVRKSMPEDEFVTFEKTGLKNITIDPDMTGLDTDYSNNKLNPGMKVHFGPAMPSFYDRNLYMLPWADINAFDRLSPGILVYLCDLPRVELNNAGINGHYGIKLFGGYNILMNSPLIKVTAEIIQGEGLKTMLSNQYTFINDYSRNIFSLKAYRNSEGHFTYTVSLFYDLKARLEENYRTLSAMPEREGIVGISGTMNRRSGRLNLNAALSFEAANSVFYSTADYNRVSGNAGIEYDISGFRIGADYFAGAVFDSLDTFNAYYLGSDSIRLFNDIETGNSFKTGLYWNNSGMGYMTQDTMLYASAGKLRLRIGMRILNAYLDIIHAGTDIYYQAGIAVNAGRLLWADIPIYNGSEGFILSKTLSVRVGSSFL